VSGFVVDHLEVVEVDHHRSDRARFLVERREQDAGPLEECTPVQQVGKRVGARQLFQLAPQPVQAIVGAHIGDRKYRREDRRQHERQRIGLPAGVDAAIAHRRRDGQAGDQYCADGRRGHMDQHASDRPVGHQGSGGLPESHAFPNEEFSASPPDPWVRRGGILGSRGKKGRLGNR
jgi:hypothetical protein